MTNVIPFPPKALRAGLPSGHDDVPEVRLNRYTLADLSFGYSEHRASVDWDYIRTNMFIIGSVGSRTEDMQIHLLSRTPRAHIDLGEALLRREDFADLPLHEVCRLIMLSERPQWDQCWVYYSALVLEFAGRLHQASMFASQKS